jgi:hypothetical protein
VKRSWGIESGLTMNGIDRLGIWRLAEKKPFIIVNLKVMRTQDINILLAQLEPFTKRHNQAA